MMCFYPTTQWKYREKLLNQLDGIFSRLKSISKENKDLEQIEFHDMLREGVISPHSYYTAKYRYKNLFIDTGTLFDSHIGSSCWCTISAPKREMYMLYKGIEITDENPLPEDTEEDYDNMTFDNRETEEYEDICTMNIQETMGFEYKWKSAFSEYREELERLLFPEIYDEYDKDIEEIRKQIHKGTNK